MTPFASKWTSMEHPSYLSSNTLYPMASGSSDMSWTLSSVPIGHLCLILSTSVTDERFSSSRSKPDIPDSATSSSYDSSSIQSGESWSPA